MAQCYRHNWVGLPGEMCPRCCDEAAALTARLASLESDLARVTADNGRLVAELYLREDPSAKIAEVCRERDRVIASLLDRTRSANFAWQHATGNVGTWSDLADLVNWCAEQAERVSGLERMIAAHEWAASIDGYPACTECGESPHATDTGTGEPIPGTHIPGCAWGEAAKRGKTPGGEG